MLESPSCLRTPYLRGQAPANGFTAPDAVNHAVTPPSRLPVSGLLTGRLVQITAAQLKTLSWDEKGRRLCMSDYVEVRDEPRHRHRFENAYARVYDVLVPPGDTTLYHRHTEDTLYVAVAPASILDQTLGEDEWQAADVPAGVCVCRHHRKRPLTHRVSNNGDRDMRMIGVEVKQGPERTNPEPFAAPGLALSWERERLRAYSLSLEPGASTGPVASSFTGVSILLESGCVAAAASGAPPLSMSLAAGDVLWMEQQPLAFESLGPMGIEAVLVEWR